MSERMRLQTVVLETLVAFARDRLELTSLRMKTDAFLKIADAFDVDDRAATPRVVPLLSIGAAYAALASLDAEAHHYLRTRMVRVGSSFEIRGPCGVVRVEEDAS